MTDKLCIEDRQVSATSPEGKTATMPIDAFLAKVAPSAIAGQWLMLPDGVKAVARQGAVIVWVYEQFPCVHNFLWIASDSPSRFGKGTKYRSVRIALPHVIMLAVFVPDPSGQLQLSSCNECFFRNGPLKSWDDELCFPALLNCSKFTPDDGRPLAWICTQHLGRVGLVREADANKRLCAGFEALRRCLFETGFNYSSEHHEGASWFSESRKIDSRISTVENWEAATAADPLFVLEVPWLATGRTLRAVTERIFKNTGATNGRFNSAAALARVVFNHK